MNLLTARPENIIGNIALSSLYAGLPIGTVTAIASVIYELGSLSFLDLTKRVAGTIIFLPAACFMCGLLLIAPALLLLRHFGFGGPALVYGMSFIVGCSFFELSMQGGFYVLTVAMVCSIVFCKRAYQADQGVLTS
jgi:hypothetical protein